MKDWPQHIPVIAFCLGMLSLAVPLCAEASAKSSANENAVVSDSLTLARAQALARVYHPDVRLARADLEVARADSTFAGNMSFNPELELGFLRGGESFGSGTDGSWEARLAQEFELWGKRGARQSVASAHTRTTLAELQARIQSVESDIRARFQRALFLQNRVGTFEEITELDRRVARSTRARVEDGTITPLTGRLTDLDLLRIEAQTLRARREAQQSLVSLGAAIGIEIPPTVKLVGGVVVDSLSAPDDSVVALALRSRRERSVLAHRIEEQREQLRLAQREGRPNLTVGARMVGERQTFDGSDFSGDPGVVGGIDGVRSTDYLWGVDVSIPLPLWQRNQAGRARADAEVKRGQIEYDRFVVLARFEVVGSVRRFEEATQLYRLYLERADQVRQDLAMVRTAYADGRISLDSYLTQKGRLVDTLLAELDAADAYWETRGDLESVVGTDLAHINAEVGR